MEAHVFMDYGLFIVAGLLFLYLVTASVAIARGDQFITVERRWFGTQISSNKLKLIPDVYIGGSSAGNGQTGEQNGLMSLALLQYLTGRSVLPAADGAPKTS